MKWLSILAVNADCLHVWSCLNCHKCCISLYFYVNKM